MQTPSVILVYRHDDFYVVDKPCGVGFHDETLETGERQKGFFNLCCEALNEELYPVHRLDKITSGLLILARNKAAANWFQTAFEQKSISKLYLALATKKPKKKQGAIVGDMEKSRGGQWKLMKSRMNPAITRFFNWGVDVGMTGLRLFLVRPETGKTHQIRVALKSAGSAILGDTLYGGVEADRGYLHAYGLKFSYDSLPVELYLRPASGTYFSSAFDQAIDKFDMGFHLNWPK